MGSVPLPPHLHDYLLFCLLAARIITQFVRFYNVYLARIVIFYNSLFTRIVKFLGHKTDNDYRLAPHIYVPL